MHQSFKAILSFFCSFAVSARAAEFHANFTEKWHKRLDAGFGECFRRRPEVRVVLIKRQWAETSLDAYVIMPNHLYALVTPQGKALSEVMQSSV